MELCRDQLLERFEIQCNKRLYNFPFLLGQGVWMDSEKLKPGDRLRKILKHGTLSIGFIGLAECLKALIGVHHGESEEAQKLGLKIIKRMRQKCDEFAKEYNLNFTCLATPAEGLSGRFVNIDKAIYGKIKGVTDRSYYTNSFHVPVYFNITIKKKIELEAPYHALTNAGHISYIELDGDTSENVEAFEKVVRIMKEAGIGYGAVNHPVDRDPVCGYVGIIKDVCPKCGRREGEGVSLERITSLNCECGR
jgi:ribonucleoside-triphosphate reductase